MPLVLFVGAYASRLYHVERVRQYVDDTSANAPATALYVLHGIMAPDNWWTQPAKNLLRYPGELLFGNDLIGWRMPNVIMSALTVVVVYLLARRVFRSYFAGFVAGVLLALDPLALVMARSTSEDVMATLFVSAGVLYAVRFLDLERESDLLLCGLFFALAVSLRNFTALVLFAVIGVIWWRHRVDWREWWARAAAYLVGLPATLLLASYLPWLSRGYGFVELMQLQVDTFRFQKVLRFIGSEPVEGAWRWLFGFPHAHAGQWTDGPLVAITENMTNPPVWWLMLPALVWLAWQAYRTRDLRLALPCLAFAAPMALFLAIPRDVLLYSALVVVPFGIAAIAGAISKAPRRTGWTVVGALVLWSVYVYPLASAMTTSKALYSWLVGGF
jgi:4-amino-4-deoxy-L-arabinose transferase-like glycosyltransferase